ncbi:MAG: hypothetical protein JWO56_115 [Acidobacteria bacterium]|nr:hypothetical protein [Acidobacteriota bacterium]
MYVSRITSPIMSNGLKLATVRGVRSFTIVFAFFATAALAQPYGSSQRAAYEKEANGPHGECNADWIRVADGLDYRAINCLGEAGDLDVNVIRVDTKRYQLNVASGDPSAVRDVARATDADFAINASFFDAAKQPLGVLARSGAVIQDMKTSSWQSIFLVTRDGRPKIILPSQWRAHRGTAWMAVQAGPRLVVGGHTNRVHQSYAAARAGVCIAKDGSLLFFATPQERKLDMYEIGRVARRGPEDGGLGCQDSMLFDGGHSTQFFLEGDTKRVTVNGDPVPVFVYATRRR